MKFLSNIDLQKNQLLNAVIQVLPSAPTNGVKEGQIYFDSVSKSLKVYNGTAFDTVGKEYAGTIALAAGLTLTVNNNMTIGALTNGHVLFADGTNTIGSEAQLAVSRGGTGIGTYTKGDILYSNETNGLAKLGIGNQGTVLRVSSAGVPEWATGGSVDQALVIKFDGGVIPNTDTYTFNGSEAKTIDFIGGNLITIDKAAGAVTFKHDQLGAAYTTTANTSETLTNIELLSGLTVDGSGHVSAGSFRKLVAGSDLTITPAANGNITIAHGAFTTTTTAGTPEAPGFGGTFDVVDSITTDNGHVTAIQTTTITMPTETTLTDVDAGTGTWLTDITVNDHEITISRSDTTTAKITVGELHVKAEEEISNGNALIDGTLTVKGDLIVEGTTTTLDTQTVLIKDNIIEINSNQTGTPASSLVSGIEVNRGDEANFQFVFVENTDDFRLGKVGGTLQPVLTRDEVSNLAQGDILVYDATNKKAIGKTFDELALPQKFAVTLHTTQAEQLAYPSNENDVVSTEQEGKNYIITHGLGTSDVTVTLREIGGEIVHTNIVVTDANTVTIKFATAPAEGAYRVTIIG
jgi:hypothetical protein